MKRWTLLATLAALLLTGNAQAAPPNDVCDATERNAHSVQGPDGGTYLTWTSQRSDYRPDDSVGTGCFFEVDHGTDPRMISPDDRVWPPYGYAIAKGGAPAENQEGYKSAGGYLDGYRFLYTLHRESGTGLGHACLQHHEAHLVVVRAATNAIVFRRHWLANFGPARYNGDDNVIFRPAACTNQHELARASSADLVARRSEPVKDATDGLPMTVYNPWQFGREFSATGLDGFLVHNRKDATHVCKYVAGDWCASAHPTGSKGLGAGILLWNVKLHATGAASGDFCTDPKGLAVQDCSLANSVKQYIEPGFSWNHHDQGGGASVECTDAYSGNGRLFRCHPNARDSFTDFEDANNRVKAAKN